jgi:hypothetical protein
MPDEFFFLSVAGLGLSLAGFAGLIHAMDRSGDAGGPTRRWRINNMVVTGFGVALGGILVWPAFQLTDDPAWTVRVVSAVLAVWIGRLAIRETRPSDAWPSATNRRAYMAIQTVIVALLIVSVVIGSVGFFELMFCILLVGPAGTFISAVSDLHDAT